MVRTISIVLEAIWNWLVDWLTRHPELWIPVILAILRSFGTTVQTGSTGVLFAWGRARRTLEPGFHWLIPIVQQARSTPTRSVTIDLPRQRVTTADGLVYDVDATLVYRVEDPIRSLVEIDDVKRGCATVLPLALEELMRGQTQATLADRRQLDATFADMVRARLAQWGVAVEQAGLTSIAPTRPTLRLTQLGLRTAERERVMEEYARAGLSPELALALLGGSRRPMSRSAWRYRRRRHPRPALSKPGARAEEANKKSPADEFLKGLLGEEPTDARDKARPGTRCPGAQAKG